MPTDSHQVPPPHPLTRAWGPILSAAILAWGSYIAIGAYFADDQRNVGKPLVILGCTIFFVVLWSVVWWAASKKR